MSEISREAGGLPMLFILKSAILIFVILLFIQVISKLIDDIIYFLDNRNADHLNKGQMSDLK
tara:strand:- start:254 stop:439 length:186 start_codon:yes stop_codon:yes gene_type:complete